MLPLLRKLILQLLIFAAVGEVALRVDREAELFTGGTRLDSRPKSSAELDAVKSGAFRPEANQYRVMLLGDSYLFGGGVPENETFAAALRRDFGRSNPAGLPKTTVLDLTMPGSNTFTNTQAFQETNERFQPHLVLLAYNQNDTFGRMEPPAAQQQASPPPAADRKLNMARSIRRFVFQSALLQFLLTKLNLELKLLGIVLPGSEFDFYVNMSHDPSFPGWKKSQEYLRSLAETCRERNAPLVVVNVPELNMLSNRKPFEKAHAEIRRFFSSLPGVTYLDGAEPFLAAPPADTKYYAVSRYDGHPNGRAHQLLAGFVYRAVFDRRVSGVTGAPAERSAAAALSR